MTKHNYYYFVYHKEMTIHDKFVLGLFIRLCGKENDTINYSIMNAKRDGFSERSYLRSIKHLKELNLISSQYNGRYTNFRILQSNETLVTVDVSFYLGLTLIEKAVLGRINYLCGEKEKDLTNKRLEDDLEVSRGSVTRALATLIQKGFIKTRTNYDGHINYRFISICQNKKNNCQNDASICQNSASTCQNDPIATCQNDANDLPKLSSSPAKTITATSNNRIIENNREYISTEKTKKENKNKRKTEESFRANNVQEIIDLFNQYIQKNAHINPALKFINVNAEALSFYDYYAGLNWHDSKGKPLKNINGRISTWLNKTKRYRFNSPSNKSPNTQTQTRKVRRTRMFFKNADTGFDNAVDLGDLTNDSK